MKLLVMKKTFCLVYVLLFTGPVFLMALEGNYVPNGSFEHITEGTPEGWTDVYTFGKISQEVAHSGKNSFKLASHADKATGNLIEIRGFTPGSTLLITSHVYVKSFKSGILKPVHMGFTSQGRTYHKHINIFPKDTDKYSLNAWSKFTYELDLSEYPDVDSLKLYCLGWEFRAREEPFVGEVFFDDISVVEQ